MPSIAAREGIVREQESAAAARRLAEAQAWNGVARWRLHERFEDDRALQPAARLQRVEQASQRAQAHPRAGAALSAAESTAPALAPEPEDSLMFITNAGVVLAAPYLPRLFDRQGLLADPGFVNDEAAQRAILLIQYAVTGQTPVPESLLLLNKLLCGRPQQAPLLRALELTAAECETVDAMLLAISGHWKALGQTSLAGLRQTFLQRQGRLEHQDDAWQLQVQAQTFDMLIDRLPWGFSTIKYPWMPEVLHVQ